MLTITFKYVGQGDCVLIEWKEDEEEKLGVIDCNQIGLANPVVEHLKAREVREIEFIILSHPHEDHFSGLNEIIEHCRRADIRIKLFGHTAQNLKEHIAAVLMSSKDKNRLADLFRGAAALYDDGLLERRGFVNNLTAPISLKGNTRLNFLAPSAKEYEKFVRSQYDEDLVPKEGRKANWLSTIIAVGTDQWHVLLTADAERNALKRVGLRDLKRDRRSLLLGQAPHHGSKHNHYPAFWKNRQHEDGTSIAVSVGPNSYGHPSQEVVKSFQDMKYNVFTTNRGASQDDFETAAALDIISELDGNANEARDLSYSIDVEAGTLC